MDYLFYRIHKYYTDRQNRSPRQAAIRYLEFCALILVFSVFLLANLLSGNALIAHLRKMNELYIMACVVVAFILHSVWLSRMYSEKKAVELNERYGGNRLNAINVWFLFLLPPVPLVLTVWLVVFCKR